MKLLTQLALVALTGVAVSVHASSASADPPTFRGCGGNTSYTGVCCEFRLNPIDVYTQLERLNITADTINAIDGQVGVACNNTVVPFERCPWELCCLERKPYPDTNVTGSCVPASNFPPPKKSSNCMDEEPKGHTVQIIFD